MASASAILDRCSQNSGLKLTGNERQLLLDALNAFHKRVLRMSRVSETVASYSVTASASSYAASTLCGTATVGLHSIRVADGSTTRQLVRKSLDFLLDQQLIDASSQGYPEFYAIQGGGGANAKVLFYPLPTVGQTIRTVYVPTPSALTDSTSSSPDSSIDDEWHMTLLMWGTLAEAFAKDEKLDSYKIWVQRAEEKLAEFMEYCDEFGGSSASELEVGYNHYGNPYPDYRSRGQSC